MGIDDNVSLYCQLVPCGIGLIIKIMARDNEIWQRRIMLLGGRDVQVMTRPGLLPWEDVEAPMQLIASQARLTRGERVLICPCGHGALGVWACGETAPHLVRQCDTNILAVEAAQATLRANHCEGAVVEVALPNASHGPVDVACLLLPKGRDLTRLYLLRLWAALRPGGRLYLAGLNRGGIKPAIADAEVLFGEGLTLAYKGGGRVALFHRSERLPDLPPDFAVAGVQEGEFESLEAEVDGQTYHLAALPGVFARHGLDEGTRLLLEALTIYPDDRVLDVGCGYGIIGMVAAVRRPSASVTMVDADLLAVECARESLRRNGLAEAVRVVLGDGPQALKGERFSLIVSNPPFHAGHEVTLDIAHSFVEEAFEALEVRGRLILVANRFLPYHRAMEAIFGAVETLAQTSLYRVLGATKRGKRPVGKIPPSRSPKGTSPDL